MTNIVDITAHVQYTDRGDVAYGEVANDVRGFLRSVWLGPDSHCDAEELEDGRALIVDFAIRAASLRSNQDSAAHGQDIALAQVACVLNYLGMVYVREGADCYGHNGSYATCGKNRVLSWLERNVVRYAEKLGEYETEDDDGSDAA